MKTIILAVSLALTLPTAFADASLQERTQVHFSGAIGSIINVFGRSATHEGVVNDVYIHKNRKLSRTGDTGELIDLDQEKIYYINYARKSYKVKTFDELRREYEESKQKAESRESRSTTSRDEKNNGPEYEVEFAVKPTGNKETINGWATREEIITVTVHEKGKTLEDAGGYVLTDDAWIGPQIAAKRELADFEMRYMKKLYGEAYMAGMQQAMAAMAATPAFAKAMKTFNSKQGALDGTPIRSKMTFESVTGKEQTADQQQQSGGGLGGLLGRVRNRNRSQDSGPQRNSMFDSSNELLKASTSASAADVAVPDDFRLEK
jgi:hypothetical protein